MREAPVDSPGSTQRRSPDGDHPEAGHAASDVLGENLKPHTLWPQRVMVPFCIVLALVELWLAFGQL